MMQLTHVLFVLLVTLPLCARAQDPTDLYRKAQAAWSQQNADAANRHMKASLDALAAKEDADPDAAIMALRWKLGVLANATGDLELQKRSWGGVVRHYALVKPAESDAGAFRFARLADGHLAHAEARALQRAKKAREADTKIAVALDALERPEHAVRDGDIMGLRWKLGTVANATGNLELEKRIWRSVVDYYQATRIHEKHPAQLRWLQSARGFLGAALANMSLFDEAIKVHSERVDAWRDRDRTAHEFARGELATTLTQAHHFERALEIQREVVAYFESLGEHAELPTLWRNLANILSDSGSYWNDDILQLRLKAIAKYREWQKSKQPKLAARAQAELPMAQWEIADDYGFLGDYVRAYHEAEQARDALVERFGAENGATVPPRGTLAKILKDMGDLDQSLRLFEKNLEIQSKRLPDNAAGLCLVRTNFSSTLIRLGRFDDATKLLQAALRGYANNPYPNKQRMSICRSLLGQSLMEQGKHEEALVYLEKALADASSPYRQAEVRTWIGAVCRHMNDLDKARRLLELAVPTLLKTAGYDSRFALQQQALTLAAIGDRAALTSSLEGIMKLIGDGLPEVEILPGRLNFKLTTFFRENAELVLSLARNTDARERLERGAFEVLESLRGATLRSAALRARVQADPQSSKAIKRAWAARGRLARLASLGLGSKGEILDAARERDAEEFKAVFALLEGRTRAEAQITTEELKQKLTDRAAVAYRRVTLRTIDPKAKHRDKTTDRLFALVVTTRGAQWKDLGDADEIARLCRSWWTEIHTGIDRGETLRRAKKESSATQLAARIIAPVRAMAGNTQHWHVCLDDELHTVPIDQLQWGRKRIRFQFENSLHRLARDTKAPVAKRGLMAIGGLDYGTFGKALNASEAAVKRSRSMLPPLGGSKTAHGEFDPLPSSGEEVKDVAALYRDKFKTGLNALTGRKATRTAFLPNVEGVRFLHLATHGFYLDQEVRTDDRDDVAAWENTVRGYAPMTLCGLALSLANQRSRGTMPSVVTAEEIAGLDLRGCELAVLSACGSYLGQMQRGQGLASLQHALHAAGARAALTSRWNVDDRATRTFMKLFYRALWRDGQSKADALLTAKAKLRLDKEPMKQWAAWILTGDGS